MFYCEYHQLCFSNDRDANMLGYFGNLAHHILMLIFSFSLNIHYNIVPVHSTCYSIYLHCYFFNPCAVQFCQVDSFNQARPLMSVVSFFGASLIIHIFLIKKVSSLFNFSAQGFCCACFVSFFLTLLSTMDTQVRLPFSILWVTFIFTRPQIMQFKCPGLGKIRLKDDES